MNSRILDLTSRFSKYTLLTISLLFIATYIVAVFLRIRYPFELVVMEGGVLDHVRRVLLGKSLYVSPSLDFAPYIYAPLYYYVSAPMAKLMGVEFMPLRLVSFVSSLGSFLIIFLIVKRETKSNFPAILASSLFSATFAISGFYFDVARIDSLFLFFLVAGIYFIRTEASRKSYILAGICISLSFLTKQIAMIIAFPLAIYAIYSNRRLSLFFLGTIVVTAGTSTLFLHLISDQWYLYYVFDLPQQHGIVKWLFIQFWLKDIMLQMPVASILAVFYLFTQRTVSSRCILDVSIAAGMLGSGLLSRMHWGGHLNTLFPAYALISIFFGLATHRCLKLIQSKHAHQKMLMEIGIYLICIIQFSCLMYNPFSGVPTRKDLEAGKKIVETISEIEGDVFFTSFPSLSYMAAMAGKRGFASYVPIFDVVRGDKGRVREELVNEIRKAIEDRRFSAIIHQGRWFLMSNREMRKYYEKHRPVFEDKNVFFAVDVEPHKVRPDIYIPRRRDREGGEKHERGVRSGREG